MGPSRASLRARQWNSRAGCAFLTRGGSDRVPFPGTAERPRSPRPPPPLTARSRRGARARRQGARQRPRRAQRLEHGVGARRHEALPEPAREELHGVRAAQRQRAPHEPRHAPERPRRCRRGQLRRERARRPRHGPARGPSALRRGSVTSSRCAAPEARWRRRGAMGPGRRRRPRRARPPAGPAESGGGGLSCCEALSAVSRRVSRGRRRERRRRPESLAQLRAGSTRASQLGPALPGLAGGLGWQSPQPRLAPGVRGRGLGAGGCRAGWGSLWRSV